MPEESPAGRHRRFNLELPLWVRFRENTPGSAAAEDNVLEGLPEETTTTAISSESCFFYVARKPPLGAEATMRVDIPMRASGRGGRVLCRGNVVWVSDREVEGKTGVACTIESFRFEPPGKDQEQ